MTWCCITGSERTHCDAKVNAFEGGSYETWIGEHSYLTTRAGEIIERESLGILKRLKRRE
jgi:hypothetical protein